MNKDKIAAAMAARKKVVVSSLSREELEHAFEDRDTLAMRTIVANALLRATVLENLNKLVDKVKAGQDPMPTLKSFSLMFIMADELVGRKEKEFVVVDYVFPWDKKEEQKPCG